MCLVDEAEAREDAFLEVIKILEERQDSLEIEKNIEESEQKEYEITAELIIIKSKLAEVKKTIQTIKNLIKDAN